MRFEPVLVTGKGKRATLRIVFDSGGQKDYRMNIVQEKVGVTWKITAIVPPVKYEPPAISSGQTSAAR